MLTRFYSRLIILTVTTLHYVGFTNISRKPLMRSGNTQKKWV
jgi:hypothetical protein